MTGYEQDMLLEWWFMNSVLLPVLFIFGLLLAAGAIWYIQWNYGLWSLAQIWIRKIKSWFNFWD